MCGSCARPPSSDLAAVCFVLLPESLPESGLLVPHHEEMSCEKEEAGITQKRPRLVEERGAGEGESCTNVHGIPHETIRTLNHQPARRIEGRRSTSSGKCESENAPQSDRRTKRPDNHPNNLRHTNRRRADNARPGQDPGRQVDEQETDKEH